MTSLRKEIAPIYDSREHIGTAGCFSSPALCGIVSCGPTAEIVVEGAVHLQPRDVIGEETLPQACLAAPGGGNPTNRVFTLNQDHTPLMPCTRQRAYELLRRQRAAIFRHTPFTIIFKKQLENPILQAIELRVDSGSRITGLALVASDRVIFAANLEHRGANIRKALQKRAAYRSRRRSTNLRYRQARFDNRTRVKGWLPPSLRSRVDNIVSWSRRFQGFAPLSSFAVETVRFDAQALQDAAIRGVAYRQGTLSGYEIREYLLEKYNRVCVYCDANDVPLTIDHVVPRSRGGWNRISNLVLACQKCNRLKSNRSLHDFLGDDASRSARIAAGHRAPLNDAAAVNVTRFAVGNALKELKLPISFWSGGRTKFNRSIQNYPKNHWIDAACVGKDGASVHLDPEMRIANIRAIGRGTRQVCRVDAYGFPRGSAKSAKRRHGFSTGDVVVAVITRGKAPGCHVARIAATKRTRFDFKTENGIIGTTAHHLYLRQRDCGYAVA